MLLDNDTGDLEIYHAVENLSATRKSIFIPVRLSCSVEENERRIVQPDRAARMKEIDPARPKYNAENHTVLSVDHPNLLNLDVTALSPDEAARIILEHAQKIEE